MSSLNHMSFNSFQCRNGLGIVVLALFLPPPLIPKVMKETESTRNPPKLSGASMKTPEHHRAHSVANTEHFFDKTGPFSSVIEQAQKPSDDDFLP